MPFSRATASDEGSIVEHDSSREHSESVNGQEESDVQMSDVQAASEEDISDARRAVFERNPESQSASSESFESSSRLENRDIGDPSKAVSFMIKVPHVNNASEYEDAIENDTVDSILEEYRGPGNKTWYKVLFEDGREEDVS